MAGHQLAAKHFVLAHMAGVLGVVEGFHARRMWAAAGLQPRSRKA